MRTGIIRNSYVLVNLMAARSFRLTPRLNVRVQVNVDNVFDEDDLIVTDKDHTGSYRYIFQSPQRWSVSTSLNF
jgi:outer membrane receptor protein involved in Fe transport